MRPHPAVARAYETVDDSDLLADPIVYYQHKYYWFWYGLVGVLLPIWIPWYYFNLHWSLAFMSFIVRTTGDVIARCPTWSSFNLIFHRFIALIHFTSFVNSAAHMFGDRPYNMDMMPCDNAWISWLCKFWPEIPMLTINHRISFLYSGWWRIP